MGRKRTTGSEYVRLRVPKVYTDLIQDHNDAKGDGFNSLSKAATEYMLRGMKRDFILDHSPELAPSGVTSRAAFVSIEHEHLDMLKSIASENNWSIKFTINQAIVNCHMFGFGGGSTSKRAQTRSVQKSDDKDAPKVVNYATLQVWDMDDINEIMALDRSRLDKEQLSDLRDKLKFHVDQNIMHPWLLNLQRQMDTARKAFWAKTKAEYPKAWEMGNNVLFMSVDPFKESHEDLTSIVHSYIDMRHVYYRHDLWEKFADDREEYNKRADAMTFLELMENPPPKSPLPENWTAECMDLFGLYRDDRRNYKDYNPDALRDFLCRNLGLGDYYTMYKTEKDKWMKFYGLAS